MLQIHLIFIRSQYMPLNHLIFIRYVLNFLHYVSLDSMIILGNPYLFRLMI